MGNDYVEFKLTGDTELIERFRSLSEDFRNKVVRPAAREALEIVKDDAINRAALIDRLNTPNSISGNIDIVERKKLGKEVGAVIYSVGVRKRKKGVHGGNTYYWWWVELGTENTRSQPFLRPALNNNVSKILREFVSAARYNMIKIGAG